MLFDPNFITSEQYLVYVFNSISTSITVLHHWLDNERKEVTGKSPESEPSPT